MVPATQEPRPNLQVEPFVMAIWQQLIWAEKAGFPTTIQVADPGKMRMDKDSRKRQAKVHFFRYNCFPPASISIIAGIAAEDTQQDMNIAAEVTRLGATFQNKMTSNAKDEWMVRYVEGEVDKYTWEVHLFNLCFQSAKCLDR